MAKITYAIALFVGCLASCGSPPPPTSPAEEPAIPEPEATELGPEEAEATEEAAEPDATEEPAGETLPEEPTPTRESCASLAKSKCSVTKGCAWYAKGNKGECVEE